MITSSHFQTLMGHLMYKFKFKRCFFWSTHKVIGHKHAPDQNKMILYYETGAVREIKKWTDCECQLGTDWVLHIKSEMEKEAGIDIKLNVKTGS